MSDLMGSLLLFFHEIGLFDYVHIISGRGGVVKGV
jgi:hypothetical protein